MDILKTDLLILGSGLAGLRAAQSALQTNSDLDLTLASIQKGPSGASFTNPNGQLGMLVLDNDQARETFYKRTLKLAAPGKAYPELVRTLAEESASCFSYLNDLGLAFKHLSPASPPARHQACFWPDSRQAVILLDLPRAFDKLFKTIRDRTRFLPGWQVKQLIVHPEHSLGCQGAVLAKTKNRLLAIQAKAVIMALGGPAPLFPWNLSGQGNPGWALGILKQVRIKLINQGFVQIMWSCLPKKNFFPLEQLRRAKIFHPNLNWQALPSQGRTLIAQRMTHCPAAHGQADTWLDLWMTSCLDKQARLLVQLADGRQMNIVPCVQAGNGGARINTRGQTSMPGLFACGECASGMHGANRIGGAMISASQVFGRRSGFYAAQEAKEKRLLSEKIFINLINEQITTAPADPVRISALAHNWQKGYRCLLSTSREDLKQMLYKADNSPMIQNWQQRLRLASLQAIFESRLKLCHNTGDRDTQ